jgi:hypothetical protein
VVVLRLAGPATEVGLPGIGRGTIRT